VLVGGKLVFRTALDVDFLPTVNKGLKEPDNELTSVVKAINDLIHHWFLEKNLVQQVKNIIHVFNLQCCKRLSHVQFLLFQGVTKSGIVVYILFLSYFEG